MVAGDVGHIAVVVDPIGSVEGKVADIVVVHIEVDWAADSIDSVVAVLDTGIETAVLGTVVETVALGMEIETVVQEMEIEVAGLAEAAEVYCIRTGLEDRVMMARKDFVQVIVDKVRMVGQDEVVLEDLVDRERRLERNLDQGTADSCPTSCSREACVARYVDKVWRIGSGRGRAQEVGNLLEAKKQAGREKKPEEPKWG